MFCAFEVYVFRTSTSQLTQKRRGTLTHAEPQHAEQILRLCFVLLRFMYSDLQLHSSLKKGGEPQHTPNLITPNKVSGFFVEANYYDSRAPNEPSGRIIYPQKCNGGYSLMCE